MTPSLDELRARFPKLGVAVYALDPDEFLTLEFYDSGRVYSFVGLTLDIAMMKAFPDGLPPAPPPNDVFG